MLPDPQLQHDPILSIINPVGLHNSRLFDLHLASWSKSWSYFRDTHKSLDSLTLCSVYDAKHHPAEYCGVLRKDRLGSVLTKRNFHFQSACTAQNSDPVLDGTPPLGNEVRIHPNIVFLSFFLFTFSFYFIRMIL